MDNPQKSYDELLSLLQEDDVYQKDVYNTVMNKEDKALDIMGRMAMKDEQKKQFTLSHLSVTAFVARFAFAWQNIFTELIIERQFSDVIEILFHGERKVHVGIMIILISFFLILAQI